MGETQGPPAHWLAAQARLLGFAPGPVLASPLVDALLKPEPARRHVFVFLDRENTLVSETAPSGHLGPVMFVLRPGSGPIDEASPGKSLVIGVLEPNSMKDVMGLIENVFAPAFRAPVKWPESVRKDFQFQLDRFLASLVEATYMAENKTILYIPDANLNSSLLPSIKDAAHDKDYVSRLEAIVIHWTRQIKEVLARQDARGEIDSLPNDQSFQLGGSANSGYSPRSGRILKAGGNGNMNNGNNNINPRHHTRITTAMIPLPPRPGILEEITFWRQRAEDLDNIAQQLEKPGVRRITSILEYGHSSYLKPFEELAHVISNSTREAKINLSHLKRLEPVCLEIESSGLDKLKTLIPTLIQGLQRITSISTFYSSNARISSLLRKVSNIVINKCVQNINLSDVFDGNVLSAYETLQLCRSICLFCINVYKDASYSEEEIEAMKETLNEKFEPMEENNIKKINLSNIKEDQIQKLNSGEKNYDNKSSQYRDPTTRSHTNRVFSNVVLKSSSRIRNIDEKEMRDKKGQNRESDEMEKNLNSEEELTEEEEEEEEEETLPFGRPTYWVYDRTVIASLTSFAQRCQDISEICLDSLQFARGYSLHRSKEHIREEEAAIERANEEKSKKEISESSEQNMYPSESSQQQYIQEPTSAKSGSGGDSGISSSINTTLSRNNSKVTFRQNNNNKKSNNGDHKIKIPSGETMMPKFCESTGSDIRRSLREIQNTYLKRLNTLKYVNYNLLDIKVTKLHEDLALYRQNINDLSVFLENVIKQALASAENSVQSYVRYLEAFQVIAIKPPIRRVMSKGRNQLIKNVLDMVQSIKSTFDTIQKEGNKSDYSGSVSAIRCPTIPSAFSTYMVCKALQDKLNNIYFTVGPWLGRYWKEALKEAMEASPRMLDELERIAAIKDQNVNTMSEEGYVINNMGMKVLSKPQYSGEDESTNRKENRMRKNQSGQRNPNNNEDEVDIHHTRTGRLQPITSINSSGSGNNNGGTGDSASNIQTSVIRHLYAMEKDPRSITLSYASLIQSIQAYQQKIFNEFIVQSEKYNIQELMYLPILINSANIKHSNLANNQIGDTDNVNSNINLAEKSQSSYLSKSQQRTEKTDYGDILKNVRVNFPSQLMVLGQTCMYFERYKMELPSSLKPLVNLNMLHHQRLLMLKDAVAGCNNLFNLIPQNESKYLFEDGFEKLCNIITPGMETIKWGSAGIMDDMSSGSFTSTRTGTNNGIERFVRRVISGVKEIRSEIEKFNVRMSKIDNLLGQISRKKLLELGGARAEKAQVAQNDFVTASGAGSSTTSQNEIVVNSGDIETLLTPDAFSIQQMAHIEQSFASLKAIHTEILEQLSESFDYFRRGSATVQKHWAMHVYKIDEMFANAVKQSIKTTLESLSLIINGRIRPLDKDKEKKREDVNPFLKITVNLQNDISVSPSIEEITSMISLLIDKIYDVFNKLDRFGDSLKSIEEVAREKKADETRKNNEARLRQREREGIITSDTELEAMRLAVEEWLNLPMPPYISAPNLIEEIKQDPSVCIISKYIIDGILDTKVAINSNLKKWDTYKYLYNTNKQETVLNFTLSNPTLQKYETKIMQYIEEQEKVINEDSLTTIYFLQLDFTGLKSKLVFHAVEYQNLLCDILLNNCTKTLKDTKNKITNLIEKLEITPKDVNELARQFGVLDKSKGQMAEIETTIAPLQEKFSLLNKFETPIPEMTQIDLNDLPNLLAKAKVVLDKSEKTLAKEKIKFREFLNVEQGTFVSQIQEFRSYLEKNSPVDSKLSTKEALSIIYDLENKLKVIEDSGNTISVGLKVFGIDVAANKDMLQAKRHIEILKTLWKLIETWDITYEKWKTCKFVELNVEEMEETARQFALSLRKLGNEAKKWDCTIFLSDKLDQFRRTMPLITDLKNPALRARHWEQLSEDVNHKLEPESDNFTLELVMNLNLDQYQTIISALSASATQELGIENTIKKIAREWEALKLDIAPYPKSKGHFILRATDDIFEQLEGDALTLSTMKGSRFVSAFEQDVDNWEQRLRNVNDMIEIILNVQRSWAYLENVFQGSEDIRKQLPSESVAFDDVNTNWRMILTKMSKIKLVLPCCEEKGLYDRFKQMLKKLDKIQKHLDDYLEVKRKLFPRFYFLSNDELLEILGQTRNPIAVQPHMKKCFDAIKKLKFEEGPKAKDKQTIIAKGMEGVCGEYVPFSQANEVLCGGAVEAWLNKVEQSMKRTVGEEIEKTLLDYPPKMKRENWVQQYIGQALIAVGQIKWTQLVSEALTGGEEAAVKKALKKARRSEVMILTKLTEMVRKQQTSIVHKKIRACVTIEVHNRDVIERIYYANCRSRSDFDWIAQLRYYWSTDNYSGVNENGEVIIRQTTTVFNYGYEYLANTGRLVITPLTDRCYLTLTTAMFLRRGGSPEGPAGTGKTESVKDLGKALAKMVIVFNCSEGLDYMSLGRMFSGLAQTGGWGCFDEFNRIEIEVLSVVAQQIMSILTAISEGKKEFLFEGQLIKLDPTCAIFITMNPGYAGRTELPDNLKALFRPVAMIAPDVSLICEIMLYSEGFNDAKALSKKITTLYSLSTLQLSKQPHYDFGLRAMRAVLVSSGIEKRKNPNVKEDLILLKTLKDSNFPKFVRDDTPLFSALLSDLFPGLTLDDPDYGELIVALEQELIVNNYQRNSKQIEKVFQLYATKQARHGVMIIGEAGGGKTTIYKLLAAIKNKVSKWQDARGVPDSALERIYPVEMQLINPKALSLGELYGEYDPNTREWTDGIVSKLLRNYSNAGTPSDKWIIFDGPVDTLWIESMNTVLDESKVLTLINGERISFPEQVSFLFEAEDLKEASPATVSRCGMIYVDREDLGWEVLVQSWIDKKRNKGKKAKFDMLSSGRSIARDGIDKNSGSGGITSSQNDKNDKGLIKEQQTLGPGTEDESFEGKLCQILEDYVRMILRRAITFKEKKCKDFVPNSTIASIRMFMSLFDSLATPENCVSNTPDNIDSLPRVVELIFLFSVVWSIGGSLDDNSRKKFDYMIREIDGQIPQHETVFEYYIDCQHKQWVKWEQQISANWQPPPNALPHKILVPTVDTVRLEFLANKFLVGNALPIDDSSFVHAGALGNDNNIMNIEGKTISSSKNPNGDNEINRETENLRTKDSNENANIHSDGRSNEEYLQNQMGIISGRNVSQQSNKPCHCILVGPSGIGKTAIITQNILTNLEKRYKFNTVSLGFSAQTSAARIQSIIESRLERRSKDSLGPPSNKPLIVFIDDVNMPSKDQFGSQPPLELLRQFIDTGSWYNRQKQTLTNISGVTLLCAMAPPGGGRNTISERFQSQFCYLPLSFPSDSQLKRIFTTLLSWHFTGFDEQIRSLVDALTMCGLDIYRTVTTTLLPTPSKSHYVFNLRDLSKLFLGIMDSNSKFMDTRDSIVKLFTHEAYRVFCDRLTEKKDIEWFDSQMATKLGSYFNVSFNQIKVKGRLPTFVKFLQSDNNDKPLLCEVTKEKEMNDFLYERLDDYSLEKGAVPMDLVLFSDCKDHIFRIHRVLSKPNGHALLVGIGGSGRKSAARFGAYITGMMTFEIEITKGYRLAEFREDIKKLFSTAGLKNKPTTFLFSDTQCVTESFLEDINSLLSSGEVPNLYENDELVSIREELRGEAKENGYSESMNDVIKFFYERIRQNLHIIICMSPVGEAFRRRILMYPSLIGNCTIDWFSEWPADALKEVALHILDSVSLITPASSIVNMIAPKDGSEKKQDQDQSETNKNDIKNTNEQDKDNTNVADNKNNQQKASGSNIQVPDEVRDKELKQRVAMSIVDSHLSAQYVSSLSENETGQKTFISPTIYIGLVENYKKMIIAKRSELVKSINKLRGGINKLIESKELVEQMKVEIIEKNKIVQESQANCKILLNDISTEKVKVDERAKIVTEESKKIELEKNEIEKIAAAAERELEIAMPALKRAEAALESLNKKDMAEISSFANPPALIQKLMGAVMILRGSPPTWEEAKKQLSNAAFLQQLIAFDKNHVSDATAKKIAKYVNDREFTPEKVGKVSNAGKSLCMWVHAIYEYSQVYKMVKPKQDMVEKTRNQLNLKMESLRKLQEELNGLLEHIAELESNLEKMNAEMTRLEEERNNLEIKKDRADKLVSGLSGERERWISNVDSLLVTLGNIPGDVLIASSFLNYSGQFANRQRDILMKRWKASIKRNMIPCSFFITPGLSGNGSGTSTTGSSNSASTNMTGEGNFDLSSYLSTPAEVQQWRLDGLPSDSFSTDNALLITSSTRYPLLIDPQGQGSKWIKQTEGKNGLIVISMKSHSHSQTQQSNSSSSSSSSGSNYLKQLEIAISVGVPVLIEDIGNDVDPVLDNLLMMKCRLGFRPISLGNKSNKNKKPLSPSGSQAKLDSANVNNGEEEEEEEEEIEYDANQALQDSTIIMVKLGDKQLELNPAFRLYFATKDATSAASFSPEVIAKTNLINFAIVEQGLKEQLLATVVSKERPELEAQREALNVALQDMSNTIIRLESKILRFLSSSTGSLLDDTKLTTTLETAQKTSLNITAKLKQSRETARKIDRARHAYEGAAKRAAQLFFVMAEMGKVDAMYQFSLDAYIQLFIRSIEQSAGTGTSNSNNSAANHGMSGPGGIRGANSQNQTVILSPEERIAILNTYHTYSVYTYCCRGFFSRHRLLFSFLILIKILSDEGNIDMEELSFLLRGGVVLDKSEQPPNPAPEWLPDASWDDLTELDKKVAAFNSVNFLPQFEAKIKEWRKIYISDKPEKERLVGDFENTLTQMQRMVLIRCLRIDRMTSTISDYVEANLGTQFIEQPSIELNSLLQDSGPNTPIIFVLSPGMDPDALIRGYAQKCGLLGGTENTAPNSPQETQQQGQINQGKSDFETVALGQGQSPKAVAALKRCATEGKWLYLANAHLLLSWLPELERMIQNLGTQNGLTGNQPVHPDFRLWLSSAPTPLFPVGLLQMSIKITTEPPKGIKANMLRIYNSNESNTFMNLENSGSTNMMQNVDGNNNLGGNGSSGTSGGGQTTSGSGTTGLLVTKDTIYRRLLFSLSFFHSLLIERKKFGSLGYNIPYGFNDSDFDICKKVLEVYIGSMSGGVPPINIQGNFNSSSPSSPVSMSEGTNGQRFGSEPGNFTNTMNSNRNINNNTSSIPWKALHYLISEANYGGRITDDWDRRVLRCYMRDMFNDRTALTENYRLVPGAGAALDGYYIPSGGSLASFREYISMLPLTDSPLLFGQDSNADIVAHGEESRQLLKDVLRVDLLSGSSGSAPGTGGDGVGDTIKSKRGMSPVDGDDNTTQQGNSTSNNYAALLINDLLKKLPAEITNLPSLHGDSDNDSGKTTGNKMRNNTGNKNNNSGLSHAEEMLMQDPTLTVLLHEAERYNTLVSLVKNDLTSLSLCLKGLVVLSQHYESVLSSLIMNTVPAAWNYAYLSCKALAPWARELTERVEFVQKWANTVTGSGGNIQISTKSTGNGQPRSMGTIKDPVSTATSPSNISSSPEETSQIRDGGNVGGMTARSIQGQSSINNSGAVNNKSEGSVNNSNIATNSLKVVWLGGLCFPTAYITAALQQAARKKKAPIDAFVWQFNVTKAIDPLRDIKPSMIPAPGEGMLVQGMYLEGAGWNIDVGCLEEAKPMELVAQMPIIHFKPIMIKEKAPATVPMYKTPVYYYPIRTGTREFPSFVITAELNSGREKPDFWVKRGTALLLSLAT